ncbi:precorrin-2 dehydrogenase/sirohydrochlorin ferrochelatase family protein [Staphylococcus massiliensis]|uniref:precorrin-2 dehydrogenase n=1 Tax=Staphylococcus massiliensis S46 TaxID=1229783 RepID=K9AL71_9STAP|nr:bifunctional precorrin-2 dehydrogenase/sirohydrochlorin ferrochelatase [Staphylococcus massiliensis]EKU46796.1 SirA [Staphylococcus massiliensis S46]MCG3399289.1 bifunctional precorrin-2 dehydrogenase/sirohydrochlorin ferrochelatase [Staphylococcus massiliensis]MCG3402360.1 bifunctional precorrin-2 dehydrogenase/sirohydrochlorin ferrochelatase [Staphylococcus massiliensis]MCG3411673.1 bifunctional precorrin-2 dehydrogenase/sirohydrochlorin ferrochelatase [Staphylococcus massiliensis]POA0137
MYPIQLQIQGKHIVVVGGGRIGFRKVSKLVREAVTIDVVSPSFDVAFQRLKAPNVSLIEKPYEKSDIEAADIVYIATNDHELNDQIRRDCTAQQLVNHTGDRTQSDFYDMKTIEYDGITINIGSNGSDYERVKALSQAIETYLDGTYKEDKL